MSCDVWLTRKLGEVTVNHDKRRIPLSNIQRKSRKGNYPYYGAQGVIDHIDDYIFEGRYLLIAEDGANLQTRNQNIALLTGLKDKFWVNNHAHILKSNEFSDIRYIMYYLNYNDISGYVTGSAQPKLNQSNLSNIEINLPPLHEQKAIATILSSLDDKIELNKKIDKNLEELAQALYKQWFVDFEFPNENGKLYKSSGGEMMGSELGLIPKGWEVRNLSEVLENRRERTRNSETQVLTAVKEGKLVLSEDFFTKRVSSKDTSKYLKVEKYDFSYNPSRVNIGSLGMNEFNFTGCVSPVYVVVRSENEYKWFFKEFFKTDRFNIEVNTRASGSVRQSLKYNDLGLMKIIYPSKEIVERFNEIYLGNYKMLSKLKLQNDNLSNTRNLILPKLMSGEIRVPIKE